MPLPARVAGGPGLASETWVSLFRSGAGNKVPEAEGETFAYLLPLLYRDMTLARM
jgi:hypothetical protein